MVKNMSANTGDAGDVGSDRWVGKILWSTKWQPTPVSLPGNFHGQKNQTGYSPWDCKELDTTEQLRMPSYKPHEISTYCSLFQLDLLQGL